MKSQYNVFLVTDRVKGCQRQLSIERSVGRNDLLVTVLPCSQILEISLKKDGTGFGFTVAGGVSSGGCYIKQLVSDPAVGDGRLQPGDRILKVILLLVLFC